MTASHSSLVPSMRAIGAYRETEARSRSPLELVVMLYDGALRYIAQARDAHANGQIGPRGHAISRALAIVGELQSTLNVADGGEIAGELDRLYTYVQGRLLDVTTKQDATALDEVHGLLSTLRDGWAQIAAPGRPGPASVPDSTGGLGATA